MIRQRSPKKDVQKKPYHTDRFYIPTKTPRLKIEESSFKEVGALLESKLKILDSYVELNQAVFYVEKDEVLNALQCLKEYGYDSLSEMSAIDFLAINNTFEIFYQLKSHDKSFSQKRRLRVKCSIKEDEDMLSAVSIYRCANWSERECFDMFGIRFLNHPYLKRILMPTDWVGYPLRKSYPLKGDEFASWYEIDKIFGRENRDKIGAEQRDSAKIVREDTINFARIGHEVLKGAKPEDKKVEIKYQEDNKPLIIKKLKRGETLSKRI